jgi:AmiR/NasT family two-component response regulator
MGARVGRAECGDRVTLFGDIFEARARVETAVGVLMELCGWEANEARSRLVSAAADADAPVETVANALVALRPEHPMH